MGEVEELGTAYDFPYDYAGPSRPFSKGRSCRGRQKPSLILTPPPAVAPRALPAGVPTLARPRGRARCGSGRVLGATAAPLDRISGPVAWATHRRNDTKPPIGVSPFLFCPLDGRAAVADCNTPSAIARPSLLRSEIAAGLSHRELTHTHTHTHHGVSVASGAPRDGGCVRAV